MTEPTPTPPARENRALMIVLSYLWVLALIPLFVEKTDADLQWHARHGLVLTAAELVVLMAWSFFVSLAWIVTGPVGCVLYLFSPLLFLAILVLHVAAIVKGLSDRRLVIPYLSEFAGRF